MLKENFMVGPFEIHPAGNETYNIYYGAKVLRRGIYAPGGTRQAVIEDLGEQLADLRRDMEDRTELHEIQLVTPAGDVLDTFCSEAGALPGMQGIIPNDDHPYWAKCGIRAMPVTLHKWARLTEDHRAIENGWIANLLPDSVLTNDPAEWRAPTSFEIRHVVGEGSFTGLSGAKAASLVGISPANFRKYTASDSAKNRQTISFAAWHLLLLRLRVTRGLDDVS